MKRLGTALFFVAFAALCLAQEGRNPEAVSEFPGINSETANSSAKTSVEFAVSAGTLASLFPDPNARELAESNIERARVAVKNADGSIQIDADIFPKDGSDLQKVISGISVISDLPEASFVGAENMAAWASATAMDESAAAAMSRIFKKTATPRTELLAEAILDADLFGPGKGRYAEVLEDLDSIVLIEKSDSDFEKLAKKVKTMAALRAKIMREDAPPPPPLAEKLDGMDIISMQFGIHDIRAKAYSAACIAGGYEIFATGGSPESAKGMLAKYARTVSAGTPVKDNIGERMDGAGKILVMRPDKLLAGLKKFFGDTEGVNFSHMYDFGDNFSMEIPKEGEFDPVEVRAFFGNGKIGISTSLTRRNLAWLAPHLKKRIAEGKGGQPSTQRN